MNNIRDLNYLVEETIQAIKELSCYKNYVFFKTKLEEHPGLKEKIINFKVLQTEVYLENQISGNADFNKELELDRIYSDIMISEEGMGFLNSEKEVKRQTAAILDNIVNGIDIEMDFLE